MGLLQNKTSTKESELNHLKHHRMADNNDWYTGHINRMDAEKKLLHPLNAHGAFLVRCSETQPNSFSLSIRDGETVKHYLIRRVRNERFMIARRTFNTLRDLVNHYAQYSDGLCVNLKKPCIRFDELGKNYSFYPDVTDGYETDRAAVKLVRKLGKGQFGEVWEGLWNNRLPVAVKSLIQGTMDPKDFLAEAQIMKKLQHPNLIKLIGVCTLEEPIYIITELMVNGSLLHYLRGRKECGNSLNLPEIIRIAAQVCRGMAYLESMNYIHRDLAARNVLMGEHSVKIADFGLARIIKESEYQAHLGTKFPIKWTAPEALSHNKFSIKSDVWSFGILLTELVTHGKTPYGEDMTNVKTMISVEKGYRMPAPHGCPLQLYDIMLECWNAEPLKRPTFETLQWKLDDFFTLEQSDYNEATSYQTFASDC